MANDERNDGWNGFANIRLERQDRKAVKALAENTTGDDVLAYILECLDEGYKVSIAPDEEHDAVIVTLTGTNGNRNSGYSMSQRHADPLVALVASRFAHVELAEKGDWLACVYDWKEANW